MAVTDREAGVWLLPAPAAEGEAQVVVANMTTLQSVVVAAGTRLLESAVGQKILRAADGGKTRVHRLLPDVVARDDVRGLYIWRAERQDWLVAVVYYCLLLIL